MPNLKYINWYQIAKNDILKTAVTQLEMPINYPKVEFPTSKLPPPSNSWHSSRIVNQVIRDNPDQVRHYEEYADVSLSDAQRAKQGLG